MSDGPIASKPLRQPPRNFVLAEMTAADLTALVDDLQSVTLVSGEVLMEPDYPTDFVWFPLTGVLSVVMVMADGRGVESDTVGYEGAVGILEALGSSVSINRTFTQIPGKALRLASSRLRHQADQSPGLRRSLIRHSQANLAQAHQSAACNALHDVNQRLCRWLLTSQDRTASNAVDLTQQYLAIMVGVQRTTITRALGELAQAGLIAQGRSRIEILDRRGLEAQVCECYTAVRANLERLIGRAPSARE
ncbi:MAG: Crp/Fnr family transcriptional regulator [Caulobacteraceae bacterium]